METDPVNENRLFQCFRGLVFSGPSKPYQHNAREYRRRRILDTLAEFNRDTAVDVGLNLGLTIEEIDQIISHGHATPTS